MNKRAKELIERELQEKTGKLNLSNCELTVIPKEISQMTNLTWLYLSNNQLSGLPESVTKLTNLTRLYLSEPKSWEPLTATSSFVLTLVMGYAAWRNRK